MTQIVLTVLMLVGLLAPAAAAELRVEEGGFAVSEDLSLLPPSVREKRASLIAAARTGDIEKLRAIFDAEPAPPTVSFGEPENPIEYLKQQSGDGEGIETLAILAKLLEAPYAAVDGGDGEFIYVWPYLAAYEDLRVLSKSELADGYKLLGYRGFEDQREIGGWIDWRVYVNPEGVLQAFVAGD